MKLILKATLSALFVGATLPSAPATTFQHVIVVVQENRTPDNLFGSNPNFASGVNIQNYGYNSQNKKINLTGIPLAYCYDPDHGHKSWTKMYANGNMNGADKIPIRTWPWETCLIPTNPQFTYVNQTDVAPYFQIAEHYGFANYMFATNQGPSFPVHQFLLSGTSAPVPYLDSSGLWTYFAAENPEGGGNAFENTGCTAPTGESAVLIDPFGLESTSVRPCFNHPTLVDLLDHAQPNPISWRYYAPNYGSIWTAPNSIQGICQPQNGQCKGPDWANIVIEQQGGGHGAHLDRPRG